MNMLLKVQLQAQFCFSVRQANYYHFMFEKNSEKIWIYNWSLYLCLLIKYFIWDLTNNKIVYDNFFLIILFLPYCLYNNSKNIE